MVAIVLNCIGTNSNRSKNLKKILFVMITFIILFGLMALRGRSVGQDTDLYCTIFVNFVNGTVNTDAFDTSIVYKYYNLFVGMILGNEPRNIIIANSFVIVLLYTIFITKNSMNIYISTILYILLYFYFQGFNIARQFIAMLLFAISMKYSIEGKWRKYIIINLLAVFIHNTAIISALIGMILGKIKHYNVKKVFGILSVIGIGSLFVNTAISIFVTFFPKYISYFTTHNIFFETGNGRRLLLIILYFAFMILGLYIFNKKKEELPKEEYRKYMIYSTLIGIACVVGTIGTIISTLVVRIGLYFELFMIIYIPMVIENISKRKEIWYFFTTIILFIPFYILLSGNNSGIIPYILYE